MKKTSLSLTLVIFSLLITSSCVSQKEVTYFQAENVQNDNNTTNVNTEYINKIQQGDIISVTVNSLSPEANLMFNPINTATSSYINQTPLTNNLPQSVGYLTDNEGTITLPLVGKVKITGLSTKEANDLITLKLDKFLQQPTVNVRILNFRISVMGEVVRPSVYTIPNEKITLTEAIGLAGDLTIYGKRNNILLIRETNGKKEFARIDLTKRDLFNSPYYYLHANDIIYVEPTKSKVGSSDRVVQLAPIILSGLSLLTVIFSNLLKN